MQLAHYSVIESASNITMHIIKNTYVHQNTSTFLENLKEMFPRNSFWFVKQKLHWCVSHLENVSDTKVPASEPTIGDNNSVVVNDSLWPVSCIWNTPFVNCLYESIHYIKIFLSSGGGHFDSFRWIVYFIGIRHLSYSMLNISP